MPSIKQPVVIDATSVSGLVEGVTFDRIMGDVTGELLTLPFDACAINWRGGIGATVCAFRTSPHNNYFVMEPAFDNYQRICFLAGLLVDEDHIVKSPAKFVLWNTFPDGRMIPSKGYEETEKHCSE